MPSPAGRTKVLVADDDRLSRVHVARLLSAWGYSPVQVSSGGEALAALLSDQAPPLCILDWEMPGLTGVQVCRMLRAANRRRYNYVLMVTASRGGHPVQSALDAGADDFVRKPFDDRELQARLRAGARIMELQARFLEASAELERLALQDPLTGLANRGALDGALERELSRFRRTREPLSVVVFDIDFFKAVNDTYGHPTGDAVLRDVAERARAEVREYDVLGRFGGEEFLLILPASGRDQARVVAERIRQSLEDAPIEAGGDRVQVTASFGVSCTEQALYDAKSLVRAADEALYAAKRGGRNRVHLAGKC